MHRSATAKAIGISILRESDILDISQVTNFLASESYTQNNMENVTIQLNDALTNDAAVIIVRGMEKSVGICLSVATNGDVEIFLKQSDLSRLVSALQQFEQK